jgi:hypothetical protein
VQTPYPTVGYRNSHNPRSLMFSIYHISTKYAMTITHRASQKWKGCASMLWMCPPSCATNPGGIVRTHCSRLATGENWRSTWLHASHCITTNFVYTTRQIVSNSSQNSNCTHLGVLERPVFSGKSSLDGQRRRVNLANSRGRT